MQEFFSSTQPATSSICTSHFESIFNTHYHDVGVISEAAEPKGRRLLSHDFYGRRKRSVKGLSTGRVPEKTYLKAAVSEIDCRISRQKWL